MTRETFKILLVPLPPDADPVVELRQIGRACVDHSGTADGKAFGLQLLTIADLIDRRPRTLVIQRDTLYQSLDTIEAALEGSRTEPADIVRSTIKKVKKRVLDQGRVAPPAPGGK